MKRKGAFAALTAIGVACSMSLISCKQNAQPPTSIAQSAGNGETTEVRDPAVAAKLNEICSAMRKDEEEKAFSRLMEKARAIVQRMPSDKNKLTGEDRIKLMEAGRAVNVALYYKDNDEGAVALKKQIETYLEISLDLGNGVTLKMALIPAGKFVMGSPDEEKGRFEGEGPQHQVTISNPFYMGIYTVTQEQYQQVMGKNPSHFKGKTNPVETVSWEDAVEFCNKSSARTGKAVRLPTEAEWEYACRAGTTTPFNTGNTIDTTQANYDGSHALGSQGEGQYRQKTTPVGSFKKNAFGLYDMHGNVWQWCSDWFDAQYYARSPKTDPRGPDDGKYRVQRGGGWCSLSVNCRSAVRNCNVPSDHFSGFGFRVVVSPGKN